MTRPPSFRPLWGCAALALVPLLTVDASAQEILALQVVRVEEDWELRVDQPDANSNGPQVSCALSPYSHLEGVHAVFELNHRNLPTFVSGGMQLQVWNYETPLASRKFPNDNMLQMADETIRWTQVMKLDGGSLVFEIINGTSTTWGNFGGQGYLRFATQTDLNHLNSYDPNVSVENSGVGFAANRVLYLAMRRVRIVLADGNVVEDETTRIVHALN